MACGYGVLGLRLLAYSSHPYPRLPSFAAPRLSNVVIYFLSAFLQPQERISNKKWQT